MKNPFGKVHTAEVTDNCWEIRDKTGNPIIAAIFTKDTAIFLVAAINGYEKLVDALETIKVATPTDNTGKELMVFAGELQKIARKALADLEAK